MQSAEINLGYTRVVAPVAGIVTSRSIDVGQLVIARTPVPQRPCSPSPTRAACASMCGCRRIIPFFPGAAGHDRQLHGAGISGNAVFHASLVGKRRCGGQRHRHHAGAVRPADNSDGALQPGAYADVKFPLPAGANGVRVPATALIFRDAGMQVAKVDATGHVKLQTVTIARDLGASVDISSGVSSSGPHHRQPRRCAAGRRRSEGGRGSASPDAKPARAE